MSLLGHSCIDVDIDQCSGHISCIDVDIDQCSGDISCIYVDIDECIGDFACIHGNPCGLNIRVLVSQVLTLLVESVLFKYFNWILN